MKPTKNKPVVQPTTAKVVETNADFPATQDGLAQNYEAGFCAAYFLVVEKRCHNKATKKLVAPFSFCDDCFAKSKDGKL